MQMYCTAKMYMPEYFRSELGQFMFITIKAVAQ